MTTPYHRSPTCGRVAPISERTIAQHLADSIATKDALTAALASPDARAKLQDDPYAERTEGETVDDPYADDFRDYYRMIELEGAE